MNYELFYNFDLLKIMTRKLFQWARKCAQILEAGSLEFKPQNQAF